MAGTDPTDQTSAFRIESIASDGDGTNQWITIRWQTVLGKSYQVYSQQELGSGLTPVGPLRSGTGGSVSQTEPLEAGTTARYYRIAVE